MYMASSIHPSNPLFLSPLNEDKTYLIASYYLFYRFRILDISSSDLTIISSIFLSLKRALIASAVFLSFVTILLRPPAASICLSA